MCNVSDIGDRYADKWRYLGPASIQPTVTPNVFGQLAWQQLPQVTRLEFDTLKREVEEMKVLLAAAKAEDVRTGQPDCEMEDKLVILRRVAEMVGVNLDDVFGKAPTA
jgi:hypothetical protein